MFLPWKFRITEHQPQNHKKGVNLSELEAVIEDNQRGRYNGPLNYCLQ